MLELAPIVLSEWTRPQQRVGRWMALGYTQSASAEKENIPLRTVQRWCKDNRLEELADMLHQRGWERVDPALWANLEHALELQKQVFSGEMKASDERWREAKHFIDRALSYRAAESRRDKPDPPANGYKQLPE